MSRWTEDLRHHGIGPLEVDILFRSELSPDQIHHISKMLKALGRYMVLDREMLNARVGGVIGLSYITKAKNYTLVREMRAKDENDQELFIFTLAPGGIYALESQKIAFHKLPLFTDRYDLQRVLTFNKYALKHGYDISMQHPQRKEFDFFIATRKDRNIVCYFPYLTDENTVREVLSEQCEGNIDSLFDFEVITIPQVQTKGNFYPFYE